MICDRTGIENNEFWTALYMPARGPGEKDPSRFDLKSEKAAWKFIYSRMCPVCRKERLMALKGLDKENYIPPGLNPACSAEWFVLQTKDFAD